MLERWRAPGLLVAAAILAVAVIDYQITVGGLPEVDPTSGISLAVIAERESAADDFSVRAWVYSLALVVTVVASSIAAARRAPAGSRAEVFTDLGVAGVALGLVTWLVSASEPTLLSDSSGETALWLPAVTMLIIAGIGRLAIGGIPRFEELPAVAFAALGLAALTLLLVIVGHSPRECGTDPPVWSDRVLWIALLTGVAAGICGLVALFQRRWIVGLITIPARVLALMSLLVAACLN